MAQPLRLVILDDDAPTAQRLTEALSAGDVVIYAASAPDEALKLIELMQHDILLVDVEKLVRMPVYPLEKFRHARPGLKVVGISRDRCGDTGLLLELLGLDAYLREPLTPEALIISLPAIASRYLMKWRNAGKKAGGHFSSVTFP
jgi:DNA-binding response OmpR family regulator